MFEKATSAQATCAFVDPEGATGVEVCIWVEGGSYIEGVTLEDGSVMPYQGCNMLVTFHPDKKVTARYAQEIHLEDLLGSKALRSYDDSWTHKG